MTTTVINREDAQREVQIRYLSTGQLGAVCIQPMSKAKLPPGTEVTAQFLALNKKIQVVVTPDANAPVAPAPSVPVYSPPASEETVTVTTSSKK
jgi:hypothetical protein